MIQKLSNKRIFITGGAGFIGSTLIGMLIADNDITVFDNLRRNALAGRSYERHPRLRVIEGDVLDPLALRNAMEGANLVVHCAAVAGIDTVIKRPTETMRINLLGTANVLEAAQSVQGIERVINFSTSEVFGRSAFRADEANLTEIGAVGEARWTYAVSKLAAEHLAKAYHQEFGLPVVTLRPFNVYGPGQVGEGALRTFILRALKNEEIEIHGDGNQIRAWCYIDDFIEGLLSSMTNPRAIGESFNIGNSRAVVTIFGLAQTVVRVLGSQSKIRFTHKSYADVELRVPSVKKARELIGFEAKIDLEEGVARTAEFYRKQSE
jgi:UDP-glucose 4-epimerase